MHCKGGGGGGLRNLKESGGPQSNCIPQENSRSKQVSSGQCLGPSTHYFERAVLETTQDQTSLFCGLGTSPSFGAARVPGLAHKGRAADLCEDAGADPHEGALPQGLAFGTPRRMDSAVSLGVPSETRKGTQGTTSYVVVLTKVGPIPEGSPPLGNKEEFKTPGQ